MTDKQNIEAVLERIEALPNSLQDEELYFYDESDTDITIANLIALAAAYREQAEMVEQLEIIEEDRNYLLWKLKCVLPLFAESRDALPAISITSQKLHGIRSDLADRMDKAGTANYQDYLAAQKAMEGENK